MAKSKMLQVQNSGIKLIHQNEQDYLSLTDMTTNFKEGSALIGKWVTNKNTLEYLSIWEKINNSIFNYLEFGVINQEAGTNRFIMSVGQWLKRTQAKGMMVKAGRYGGTYAHKDIAFHFAMWLSPEFQIYLIKEFQRLKEEENKRLNQEWNLQRTISKINYKIHTDSIKDNLIPKLILPQEIQFIYSDEADLLNMALFGMTAKMWRENPSNKKGNIRDHATLEQLVVLSNLESINALLIEQEIPQEQRLIQLNKVAITQMTSLLDNKNIKRLK